MAKSMSQAEPVPRPTDRPERRTDMQTLNVVAVCLIIAVASWFLLQQLAELLRPLCLAIFLSYVILPLYHRLRARVPGAMSYLVMAVATLLVLGLVVMLVYVSVLELSEELPLLFDKGQRLAADLEQYLHPRVPWLFEGW